VELYAPAVSDAKMRLVEKIAYLQKLKNSYQNQLYIPIWRPTLPVVRLESADEFTKREFKRFENSETKGDPVLYDVGHEVFTPEEAAERQLERNGVERRAREREKKVSQAVEQRRRLMFA